MSTPADEWKEKGACRRIGEDQAAKFFAEPENNTRVARAEARLSIIEARLICMRCPVRDECLTYALDTDQRFGVWGATTYPERKKMLATLRPQRPDRIRQCKNCGRDYECKGGNHRYCDNDCRREYEAEARRNLRRRVNSGGYVAVKA